MSDVAVTHQVERSLAWHPRLTMNLLTNGFVNNSSRLVGPPEQFKADIVELGLKGFCVNGRESRYLFRRFRADNGKPEVMPRVSKPA
jgi:hypothetical protein